MVKPIKPIYKRWSPQLQAWQWGLMPEDFARVQAGYACEQCLEPFEHIVPKCYVCGHVNEHQVVALPSEWQKQGV